MATPQASLKQPTLARALLPSKPASVSIFSSLRRVLNPSLKSLASESPSPGAPRANAKAPSSSRNLRSLARRAETPSSSPLPSAKGPSGIPPGEAGAPPSGTVIVWVRSDLRLHDNPALEAALSKCKSGTTTKKASNENVDVAQTKPLLPIFVFDPSEYKSGRSGPYRAKFLREAVSELRRALRELGSDLLVRVGSPSEAIAEVASSVGATCVVAAGEASYDDKKAEDAVREGLRKTCSCCPLELVWGGTAVSPSSLPWWEQRGVEGTPATFAEFRAAVSISSPSSSSSSSSPSSSPAELPGLPATTPADRGELPTDEQLSIPSSLSRACERDGDAAGAKAKGGESKAVEALEKWIKQVQSSSNSRSPVSLASALSPWLATGCLSARRAMEQVKELLSSSYSSTSSSTLSSSSVVVEEARRELEWRDFFRFTTAKYSERALGGEREKSKSASTKKAEEKVVAVSSPKQHQRQQRGKEVEKLWAALSRASSSPGYSNAAAPGYV